MAWIQEDDKLVAIPVGLLVLAGVIVLVGMYINNHPGVHRQTDPCCSAQECAREHMECQK